jgi:hypothetical protein
MDITAPETWGSAIYLWIVPIVVGDAIFPPIRPKWWSLPAGRSRPTATPTFG